MHVYSNKAGRRAPWNLPTVFVLTLMCANSLGLRISLYDTSINIVYPLAVLGIGLLLMTTLRTGRIVIDPFLSSFLLMTSYFLLGAIVWSFDRAASLAYSTLFVVWSLVCFYLKRHGRSIDVHRILLYYLVLSFAYLAYSSAFSLSQGIARSAGVLGGSAMTFGALSFNLLLIAIYFMATQKRRRKLMAMLASALGLLVILGGSRTSILPLPLAIVYLNSFSKNHTRNLIRIVVAAIGCMLVVTVIYSMRLELFEPAITRIERLYEDYGTQEVSRLKHYELAIALLSETGRVMLGNGLEAYKPFESTIEGVLGQINVLHSAPLQILVGGGIVGFGLYILTLVSLFRMRIYIIDQGIRRLFVYLFIANALFSLASPDFLTRNVWLLLPVLLYCTYGSATFRQPTRRLQGVHPGLA